MDQTVSILKGRKWTKQAIRAYIDTGALPPLQRFPIPKAIRLAVWHRDGGVCGLCGLDADPLDWSCDHIMPVALGGPTIEHNLRVTHPRCNRLRPDPRLMSEEDVNEAAEEWTANEMTGLWPTFPEFVADPEAWLAKLEAAGTDADLIAGLRQLAAGLAA